MTLLFLTLLISFIITFWMVPKVIHLSKEKQLFDCPNARSAHIKKTPSMGGIGIFCGVLIPTLLLGSTLFGQELNYVICGLFIIFFVGISDDLIILSPSKKLIGQSIAAILLLAANIRITSFYGILGIEELPFLISYIFSFILILFLINALNLLDGINGLAGSIALIVSLFFGTWFYLVGAANYSLLAFAVTGGLIAFLWYNCSPAVIFMGDSGSLTLGFFIAIFTIQFLEIHETVGVSPYTFENFFPIATSVIFIPVFDTLRVFWIRVSKGKSPFSPDKNHIHHLLLQANFSHSKASLILVATNLLLIGFTYSFQQLNALVLIGLMALTAIISIKILKKFTQERIVKTLPNYIQRQPRTSTFPVNFRPSSSPKLTVIKGGHGEVFTREA